MRKGEGLSVAGGFNCQAVRGKRGGVSRKRGGMFRPIEAVFTGGGIYGGGGGMKRGFTGGGFIPSGICGGLRGAPGASQRRGFGGWRGGEK